VITLIFGRDNLKEGKFHIQIEISGDNNFNMKYQMHDCDIQLHAALSTKKRAVNNE